MTAALVLAAHGTRDPAGVAMCHQLVDLVAVMRPDVPVSVGFVELAEPSVTAAVVDAAREHGDVVVVPLMLGAGSHVRDDIPSFVTEARAASPTARVALARHLGPHPALDATVDQRLAEACGDWAPAETGLVLVGRGALVPQANADHVGYARLRHEAGGWADLESPFIQVVPPSLPAALDRLAARGLRQVVVMGHWLFAGRLRTWTREQTLAWAEVHPDVEVRLAEVIGPSRGLAVTVLDRYAAEVPGAGSAAYLAGLRLEGRDVLVVGGGRVASRRVARLVAAGARVRVVSPDVTPELAGLVGAGLVSWVQRGYEAADFGEPWYVLAATDDPQVNAGVAAQAEADRVFCVRADQAEGGSAWTATTDDVAGMSVAVVGQREPHRSRLVRQAVVAALRDGG